MAEVIGTNEDDDLRPFGTADDDIIFGLDGDDLIQGNGGNDFLDGGAGNDNIQAVIGNNVIYGGTGDDLISGGLYGEDVIYAGEDNDTVIINSLSGDDYIDLGSGDDYIDAVQDGDGLLQIYAGDGDDYIYAEGGYSGYNVINGGAGDDTIQISGGPTILTYSFNVSLAMDFVDWADLNDFIIVDDTTRQNEFAKAYSGWLNHVIEKLAIGDDVNGDGTIDFDINQNDSDFSATPLVEGLTQTELDQIFASRTELSVITGNTTKDRYYSDEANGSGTGTLSSDDGNDTIRGFNQNSDKLDFSGLAGYDLDVLSGLFTLDLIDGNSIFSWDGGSITFEGQNFGTDVAAFLSSDFVVLG